MLSFAEAQSKLLALAAPLAAERVALDDAMGRVLAGDVLAPVDFPRFDYSAMDGYAVRLADFEGDGPWTLPVRGESKTGGRPGVLEARAACRIFTGAELPEGADAIVMQEDVTRDGADARFVKRPMADRFIRRRGEDLTRGAVAIANGTRLRAAHLGVVAAADLAWLTVARRPVVTLLATGDELRVPGTADRPGTIAESNCVALRAMAERAGARAIVGPFVPDEVAATERAIDDALASSDVVVTIGGVSVGDHDLVRPALEKVGVTLEFWKVAIKPGKPLAVGRRGRAIVIGLPGNPSSAMMTFALFGLPFLRALQGDTRPFPSPMPATLATDVKREPGRLEFARATLARGPGGWVASILPNQASGAVTTMANADAVVLLPADRGALAAGTTVDMLLLEDLGA
ncbi:MAG: Molybdopterin biosynthesis protein MoeA [Myxococcaceae bacterium]|nr:Molybdopterin biosynthesis protein MoeA [Myxococcaceae bacterium]